MKKKLLIIITIVLVLFTGTYFLWTKSLWKVFSCSIAGSYACVETWSFNVNEKELLEIIKEIKVENPKLQPPLDTALIGRKERYWQHILFYYSDTNQELQTWTRENEDGISTTLALIALWTHYDETMPSDSFKMDRKEINRDFEYFENKNEIHKFKERIVDLINEKISDRNRLP